MALTFSNRQDAEEQVRKWTNEGFAATIVKRGEKFSVEKGRENRRSDGASLKELELSERLEEIKGVVSGDSGSGRRLAKSVARGFGDIAKSLNSPENKRRMKIAQMVEGRNNPMRRIRVSNPIAGRKAGMHRRNISPDAE